MFNSFFQRDLHGPPQAGGSASRLPKRHPGFSAAVLALLMSAAGCSVSGPPFRDAPVGERALPAGLDRSFYRFRPKLAFFDGPQLGEVYFSSARSKENPRGLFHLRVLGRDRKGAIRVRQYEGEVHRFEERIELRSERCYLFGKREWDDRMTPLKRWECDHLVFAFESPSNFARTERLYPVVDSVRGEFTEWFQATPLEPMPASEAIGDAADSDSQTRPIFFAGQIYPIPRGESLPDDAGVVVWGFQAGRLLRDGQILKVRGRSQGGADFTADLKIISRPGDFLLCRWVRPPFPNNGNDVRGEKAGLTSGNVRGVAYTRDSLLNQGGGLFD